MEGTRKITFAIGVDNILAKIYTGSYYVGDSRKTQQGAEEVASMLQASEDNKDILLDNIRQGTAHVTAVLSRLIGRTTTKEQKPTLLTSNSNYVGAVELVSTTTTEGGSTTTTTTARKATAAREALTVGQFGVAKKDYAADDVVVQAGDVVQMKLVDGKNSIDVLSSDELGTYSWQFLYTILATRNMPVSVFADIAKVTEDFVTAFALREWCLSVLPSESKAYETRMSELEMRLRNLGSLREKPVRDLTPSVETVSVS